jgi:capsular exopolysaccharide synthesis family protein
MAQAGNNVLIIDADLRRPVMHKLFHLPQKGGLTSLLLEFSLSGNSEEVLESGKRVIQPTTVGGLHVLTSGPIPPNPSELLGSAKMDMTLRTLAEYYDFVIVDSPPVLAVTDATVLSRPTDGVLIVADAGSTRQAQLKQAVDQLLAGKANVIGVVLNKLSPGSDGYYSYYYYRQSYYVEELEESESGKPTNNRKRGISWRRRQSKGLPREA